MQIIVLTTSSIVLWGLFWSFYFVVDVEAIYAAAASTAASASVVAADDDDDGPT